MFAHLSLSASTSTYMTPLGERHYPVGIPQSVIDGIWRDERRPEVADLKVQILETVASNDVEHRTRAIASDELIATLPPGEYEAWLGQIFTNPTAIHIRIPRIEKAFRVHVLSKTEWKVEEAFKLLHLLQEAPFLTDEEETKVFAKVPLVEMLNLMDGRKVTVEYLKETLQKPKGVRFSRALFAYFIELSGTDEVTVPIYSLDKFWALLTRNPASTTREVELFLKGVGTWSVEDAFALLNALGKSSSGLDMRLDAMIVATFPLQKMLFARKPSESCHKAHSGYPPIAQELQSLPTLYRFLFKLTRSETVRSPYYSDQELIHLLTYRDPETGESGPTQAEFDHFFFSASLDIVFSPTPSRYMLYDYPDLLSLLRGLGLMAKMHESFIKDTGPQIILLAMADINQLEAAKVIRSICELKRIEMDSMLSSLAKELGELTLDWPSVVPKPDLMDKSDAKLERIKAIIAKNLVLFCARFKSECRTNQAHAREILEGVFGEHLPDIVERQIERLSDGSSSG